MITMEKEIENIFKVLLKNYNYWYSYTDIDKEKIIDVLKNKDLDKEFCLLIISYCIRLADIDLLKLFFNSKNFKPSYLNELIRNKNLKYPMYIINSIIYYSRIEHEKYPKYIEMLKIILSFENINPNIVNSPVIIFTPLIRACAYNKYDIVELLVKHPKIDLNLKILDKDGVSTISALSISRERQFKNIISLLIQNGVDIELKEPNNNDEYTFNLNQDYKTTGLTCLMISVINNDIDTFKVLLNTKSKEYINKRTKSGHNALMIAVINNRKDFVEYYKYFNIDNKTENGYNVLDLAYYYKYTDIIEILKK